MMGYAAFAPKKLRIIKRSRRKACSIGRMLIKIRTRCQRTKSACQMHCACYMPKTATATYILALTPSYSFGVNLDIGSFWQLSFLFRSFAQLHHWPMKNLRHGAFLNYHTVKLRLEIANDDRQAITSNVLILLRFGKKQLFLINAHHQCVRHRWCCIYPRSPNIHSKDVTVATHCPIKRNRTNGMIVSGWLFIALEVARYNR